MPGPIVDGLLTTLATNIAARVPAGAVVQRNAAWAETVPAAGAVSVFDGEAGTPDRTLGAVNVYSWDYTAAVECVAGGKTEAEARARYLALADAVYNAVQADKTLGGAAMYVQTMPPEPVPLDLFGAGAYYGARIPVMIQYDTTTEWG